MQEVDKTKATPPSCLSDALCFWLQPWGTCQTQQQLPPWKRSHCCKYGHLVADWNAWEDKEGEAVLIPRGSCCFAGNLDLVLLFSRLFDLEVKISCLKRVVVCTHLFMRSCLQWPCDNRPREMESEHLLLYYLHHTHKIMLRWNSSRGEGCHFLVL